MTELAFTVGKGNYSFKLQERILKNENSFGQLNLILSEMDKLEDEPKVGLNGIFLQSFKCVQTPYWQRLHSNPLINCINFG